MADITFICCYNNRKSYDSLVNSIYKIDPETIILGIDNQDSIYKSCSNAFNSIINRVKTKFVAFIHQDIIFFHKDSLNKIINYLNQIEISDLVGVAGAREEGKYCRKVLSNIVHGNKKTVAGDKLLGMEPCMTLDECLVFGYTEYFVQNPFDEKLCDNWHLYFVEQCLRTGIHGGHSYVCDIELYHKSKGNVRSDYVKGFYKLCKNYKKDYPYIATCCASSRTTFPYLQMSCLVILGSIFKRRVLKIK